MGELVNLRDFTPKSKDVKPAPSSPAAIVVLPVVRTETHTASKD